MFRRQNVGARLLALILTLCGAAVLVLAVRDPAEAHVICGNRVFPATLTMDDPGVGDELSLPTLQYIPTPGGGQNLVSAYEWDKTITRDLGVAINGDYISQTNSSTGSLNG